MRPVPVSALVLLALSISFGIASGQSYTLTVSLIGSGTVTSSPAGINCGTTGTTCSADFPSGSTVTLTGTSDVGGWYFDGFTGDCIGNYICNVTMDGPKSVTATFTFKYQLGFQTLPYGVSGPGYVTINGNPNWNCGFPGGCQPQYPPGTVVTIAVNPPAGWALAGWGGACSGSGSSECTFVMDSNMFASATLNPKLTVFTAGSGSVTSSPAGINCGTTCSTDFPYQSTVTLTATPGGYASSFTGWSGDCTGTGTCTVTMDGPKNVSATFATAAPATGPLGMASLLACLALTGSRFLRRRK